MKKYYLLLILIFGFLLISEAQDCEYARSSKQLLENMTTKPLTNVYYLHFKEKCNVTNEVRNRILYHLDWHWTQNEIDTYLETYFNDVKNFYRVDTLAKIAGRGNDSLYKVSYDSIEKIIKAIEFSKMDFYVNNDIILGVANANIKEAIPILKKAIKDPAHYHINRVELALARFGDRQLQKKIIDNCKNKSKLDGKDWLDDFLYGDAEKLLFISSQESICKINEWMDTSKILNNRMASGRSKNYKTAMFIISILKRTIKNADFQKLTQNFNYDAKDDINNQLIINCKKWLLKNKGKFQLYNFNGVGNPIDEL